jgi:hypothetical protein
LKFLLPEPLLVLTGLFASGSGIMRAFFPPKAYLHDNSNRRRYSKSYLADE